MASSWVRGTAARSRASRVTGTMARRCSREANSGTTPPYLPWVDICEATTDESTRSPSSTTAAAVSSQDDSMPRMRIGISFYGSLLFEEADEVARAQAGGAALTIALESGGDEDAALGGEFEVQEQGAGRVLGVESLEGLDDGIEDDG